MSAAPSERVAVAAIVVATLLWGATFVVIRDSVSSLSPAVLVCGRFAVAALVLALVLVLRRRGLERATLRGGIVSGTFGALGFLFQAVGLESTSAGSSAFLTCAGTLLAGFFAWPLLRQRPSAVLALGLLVALAGSALLSLREGLQLGRGELWTLAGAACYALQVVALARVAPAADPLELTAVQAGVIALGLAPFALPSAPAQFAALGTAGWLRFAYLAIAGSLIASFLQVFAQRRLPPGRVGLLFALEPVFALAFAITAGAESFALRWWMGAALILMAVVGVEWDAARRPAGRPATP